MKVHIKIVDGYNVLTKEIIPLEEYDKIELAIKNLIHKKKTFYIVLFKNDLCKDIMKFEKGKRVI